MLLLNPLGKIFQDPLYQGNPGYELGNAWLLVTKHSGIYLSYPSYSAGIFNEELYSDIMLLLNPLGKIFQDPLYQGNPGYELGNA
jgi:hypothetical protein